MRIDKSGPFEMLRPMPLLAFSLGVAVGLGIANRFGDSAARPEVQARAAPSLVAQPAVPAASVEVAAKPESLPSPGPRPSPQPAQKESLASSAAGAVATLSDAVDAGKEELSSAEPPTEQVAEMRPLDAAQSGSSPSAQIESAQDSELRAETEKAAPQTPLAPEASLLPHERL